MFWVAELPVPVVRVRFFVDGTRVAGPRTFSVTGTTTLVPTTKPFNVRLPV